MAIHPITISKKGLYREADERSDGIRRSAELVAVNTG
jgi:hypothetical protein